MLFNNLAVRDCGKCCSYHLNEYIKLEEVKGSIVCVHESGCAHQHNASF